MNWLNDIIGVINNYLWSYVLIVMLIGIGLWFTVRTRFVQIRCIPEMFRLMTEGAGAKPREGHISTFQAFCVSTASRVGVGNIAGIAIAVATGGPGAVFWMWVIATIGAASGFVESTLAQIYKAPRKGGGFVGGPAYYITLGMGEKWRPLAVFFSIAIIIALGCIGNMVQSNSIAHAMQTAFNVPAAVSGVVCAVLAGLVFFGGVGRLASVTEKIVPFMAAIYLIGGLWVIGAHITEVIPAFRLIFVAAFDPEAVMGGALGLTVAKAMQFGVARGLFSNEAGMGSTPHAHAVARVEHPAEQGLVAMFGVFTTVVIVTFTGIVILVTGVLDFKTTGIELTQHAYTVGLGSFGMAFVAVCLFFFAFSTIMGWYFFGEQNVRFLFRSRGVLAYRVIVCAFIVTGAMLKVDFVWSLADLFNGLMVLPNLVALVALHKVVGESLEDFEKKLDHYEERKSENIDDRMQRL